MKHIGLVTCEQFRDDAKDDDLLAVAFSQRGYASDRPAWEDPAVRWEDYDALIIRSTWDYHFHLQEFLDWIARIETMQIPLFNPPAVLRWNATKVYLRELESNGVWIPPTEWIVAGKPLNLVGIMDRRGWKKVVVKPLVGGGSNFTYLIDRNDAESHAANIQKELFERGALIQEFLPEIVDEGEWSFIFLGGKFSHAIMKTPKAHDFRVQNQFGGTYRAVTSTPEFLRQTQEILELAPAKLLYARVDGIVRKDKFMLIELEVCEPWLYLDFRENSEHAVVDAFEYMTDLKELSPIKS